MDILNGIKSQYVIKCYELYENISYMAVVLEYISEQYEKDVKELKTLAMEIDSGKIHKDQYEIISKHIFQGMDALRQSGI
jgi:hypothetical protein